MHIMITYSPQNSNYFYIKGSVTVRYIFVHCWFMSLFAKNL